MILAEKLNFEFFARFEKYFFCTECYQTVTFCCMSFIIRLRSRYSFVKSSLTCNLQKYSNIEDGARGNKIRGASCNTNVFFFILFRQCIK